MFLKIRFPLTLLKTERPLLPDNTSGTKIDFHFRNKDSNTDYFVEIVNIHLDEKNTSTYELIERLLDQKIRGKLLQTGIKKNKDFLLFPVLWGGWDKIKAIADYYKFKKLEFENTSIPLAFVPFSHENGIPINKFGTIDIVFENSVVQ